MPNDFASVGISAMITFIALVLVSAVISIALVSIGQEIFQSSQTDSSKTENIIYGKVIITSAVITVIEFDANNDPIQANLFIALELSPGAPTIDDDLMKWMVLCPNENDESSARWTNEGNLESVTTATGDGGDIGAVEELVVGIVYMINLQLSHTSDTNNDQVLDQGGCPPNYLETHTLIFAYGGTGSYSSWDLRYDESISSGEAII